MTAQWRVVGRSVRGARHLRNHSVTKRVLRSEDGTLRDLVPEQSCTILPGTTVLFGYGI